MLTHGGVVVVWCSGEAALGFYTAGQPAPLSLTLPKIRPSGHKRIMILMTPVRFVFGENNVDRPLDTFTAIEIIYYVNEVLIHYISYC